MDAGEGIEDVRSEALGALGDGGARMEEAQVGNTKGKGADGGGQFAPIIAKAIIEALRGLDVVRHATKKLSLSVDEELEETSEAVQKDGRCRERGVRRRRDTKFVFAAGRHTTAVRVGGKESHENTFHSNDLSE